MATSPVAHIYDKPLDRESAFEMLKRGVEERQPGDRTPDTARVPDTAPPSSGGGMGDILSDIFGTGASRNKRLTPGQRAAREATRTAAGELGKAIGGASGGRILRSVLGGILGR
jgi:hypothetical protein